MTASKKQEQAIEWRRNKIQELMSKGYSSQREIADILQVSYATTSYDMEWLRSTARERLKEYLTTELPKEMETTLVRLNTMIKTLHKDMENPNMSNSGGIGNIFNPLEVDACIQEYTIEGRGQFKRYIGVDPGYASSKFAIVVLQWKDSVMEIIHIENVKDILYTDSIKLLTSLISRYNPCKVYIDYAASSLIHELNHRYGYPKNYENYDTETLRRFRWSSCKTPLFIPVSFGSNNEHKELMQNTMSVYHLPKPFLGPAGY